MSRGCGHLSGGGSVVHSSSLTAIASRMDRSMTRLRQHVGRPREDIARVLRRPFVAIEACRYRDGEITKDQMIDAMVFAGLDEERAVGAIRYIGWAIAQREAAVRRRLYRSEAAHQPTRPTDHQQR